MDIKAYIQSGILENHLLGNNSQEENSILECISKNNAEVKSALNELENTLEILADSNSVEPPQHLKSEIFAKLNFATSAPIEETPILNSNIPTHQLNVKQISPDIVKGRSNVTTWLAAASVVLLMTFGWTMYSNQKMEQSLVAAETQNSLNKKEVEFLANQNTMLLNANKIQLNGVEKHPDMVAHIYWDGSENVYFESGNLPTPPEGKQYQVWAIVDGKPVDLGMYVADGKKVHSMKSVKNAQAFGITLEKEGGSKTPTMEQMMVMGEV
ncbi:anti-sigma factor [Frigoriflavimonas asaccharolytica]|uniref:Anti-sigma-K factor RskA n=1 Tax=Frigoriflavimonas asaccharolytica TaxID=2735899 RepID=A0A8J8G716_9FLAO|nr:anti-sigma factor [Frigoriflavimonas asaccharolytica]NRS92348.1 anti-sigma-K factor RskA [Frigoriflavimonas asaccharolytica]